MNFAHFLAVLSARRKIVIAASLSLAALAFAFYLLVPATYEAAATLVLNYKGLDPISRMPTLAQNIAGQGSTYMATQIDIAGSQRVALNVVDKLRLADDEQAKEEFKSRDRGTADIRLWLANLLLRKLEVVPSRDSSVLTIAYRSADPQFAAAVANAFAAEYQKTVIQLTYDPLKKASAYFSEQIKNLRENLENAQARRSRYQHQTGLISADARLDIETTRLSELANQLATVQGQLLDATLRNEQAQGKSVRQSPDIVANSLIQSIKVSLAQAEVKFAQVAKEFTPMHPVYQAAKAEVDKFRSQLDEHTRTTAKSLGVGARILKHREEELSAALQAQKEKVLGLNRARDELEVLSNEVEGAQRAYDAAVQRFNQTQLEGNANQTEIAVLNPAHVPLKPSPAKTALKIILAGMVGAILGILAALLAEFADQRVRLAKELAEVLQVPVFGIRVNVAPALAPIKVLRLPMSHAHQIDQ